MEPTPKDLELNYVPLGQPPLESSKYEELNAAPAGNTAPPVPQVYAPYHTHNGTDSPFLQQIRMGSGANSAHLDPNQGLWMGADAFSSAPFRVDMAGNLVATSATITIATLGGFDIGADYIRDAANSMGLASTVTGGDDVRFWAGAAFASRATAPFRAYESGAVTMDNVTITGGSITGAGVVAVVALNLANRGWSQTCAFTVTDADTIAWGSGSFVTADGGTTLSISAGNTGNMAAKTYIYLDAGVSLTAYQTTTTASTAVGASKVLIAIAQNGTGEATFTVMGGMGGQNIDAGNIVANSITANELSTSITYAGAIIIDSSGMVRSGQTAYNTGTGWFLGNVAGTPKFSIGNPSGDYITWDGTSLTISGVQKVLNNFTAEQDLTIGTMVGICFDGANTVSKAFAPWFDTSTPSTLTSSIGQTCSLESGDKFVFAYKTATNTIKVSIGTFDRSTRTISWGTEATATTDAVSYNLIAIGAGKFCIAYESVADGTKGYIIGATVSGTTITFGTATLFFDHASSNFASITGKQIATDKVILCWEHSNSDVRTIAVTFSGTTPTIGTKVDLDSTLYTTGNGFLIVKISTDKFVVWGSATVQCGSVSGTTITLGTAATSLSISSDLAISDMVSHDTDKFVVKTNSSAQVCTVSGTSITLNTTQTDVGAGIIRVVSSTEARVYTTSVITKWVISGSTITATTIERGVDIAPTHQTVRNPMVLLSNGYWALFFTTSSTVLRTVLEGMSLGFIGIVQATVSRSATVSVLVKGKDSNQSGLTAGAVYNFNTATPGALALAELSNLDSRRELTIMRATSSTELVI